MAQYPTIGVDNVIITQYPHTEADEWVVVDATGPSGMSFTKPRNANVVRRFVLRYLLIQWPDVVTLETFFFSVLGRLGNFDFVDDQGKLWHNASFDQDVLEIKYNEPKSYSTEVHLKVEDDLNVPNSYVGTKNGEPA
jgi:hypothetical protein